MTDPETSATSPTSCADTDSWEQKMAQTLEDMDEVVRYVKNHNLGFYDPLHLRTARSTTTSPTSSFGMRRRPWRQTTCSI